MHSCKTFAMACECIMLSSVDNIIVLNVILCNIEVGLPLVCVTHMHCQLHVLRACIVSCMCYVHALSVACVTHMHCQLHMLRTCIVSCTCYAHALSVARVTHMHCQLQVCRGVTGKIF